LNKASTFKDKLYTTLHEATHVLGFSGSLMSFWWNPATNSRYNTTTNIIESMTFRNISTNILKTPKVT
jgi:hypothetical protein